MPPVTSRGGGCSPRRIKRLDRTAPRVTRYAVSVCYLIVYFGCIFFYSKSIAIYVINTPFGVKAETIHQCFLPELNAMLHSIQISTNTCEITMQVKRVIGKATIH